MARRLPAYVFLAALLLLAGCGELRPPPKKYYAAYHTVRPGDTLYSIAWRYGHDYREVASWNRIRAPYHIYPGQRLLVVPTSRGARVEERSIATAPAARTTSPPAARPAQSAPAARSTRPQTVEKTAPRPHPTAITWQWPTAGQVTRGFNNSASKKGVNITGRMGQPVYAASGGHVVYSGSGLVGYGNLVIIKHDDVFLSAYGHNRRLLVKEGETVKPGQMIAEMGGTAKDGAVLHFEIRQEGRPVDPVRHLPKKRN